jgi:hypothetical protein
MARPKTVPTLADLGFSPAAIDEIEDLREGFIGAPAHRVIEHVIRFYLEKGISDEPQVKRRYDEAKEKRRASRR